MKISSLNNWAIIVLPKQLGIDKANVRISGRYNWLKGLKLSPFEEVLLAAYIVEYHMYDTLDIYKDCQQQCHDIIVNADNEHRRLVNMVMEYELGPDSDVLLPTATWMIKIGDSEYAINFGIDWLNDLVDDGISFRDQLQLFMDFKNAVRDQVILYSLKTHAIGVINNYLNPQNEQL
jgi:hypothetical protein